MGLIDLISNFFKIFFVSCVCIVPVAFVIGMIITSPLTLWSDRRSPASAQKRKSSRKVFSKWPELLASSFSGGFASFPIARLVIGSPFTLWNYLALTVALVFFALITPGMSGETLVGESDEETNRNLYAFWAGLALGGLAGALSVWFWSR